MNDTQRLRLENAINEYARAKVQAFQLQNDRMSSTSLERAEESLNQELDAIQADAERFFSFLEEPSS